MKKLTAVLFITLAFTGCRTKDFYLIEKGMDKQRVLNQVGRPHNTEISGDSETWIYTTHQLGARPMETRVIFNNGKVNTINSRVIEVKTASRPAAVSEDTSADEEYEGQGEELAAGLMSFALNEYGKKKKRKKKKRRGKRRKTMAAAAGAERTCLEAYGKKKCGYGCIEAYGKIECGSQPGMQCIEAYGKIKCGFDCKEAYGKMECGSQPGMNCVEAYGKIKCGFDCAEKFGKIECSQ